MSQRVELASVRFSDIERAYYFYDLRHPEAIQFAINGNWESWHVGWVKHHTHDPVVKRIAEDAEAHLVRSSSTYQQWHPASAPELAPVRLPPPSDVDAGRSTTNKQPPHPHQVESPPSANISPIYLPTINSSVSPPSLPAPLFSPALHSASTPRSHSGLEETPSSSTKDHSLELPPILSPALTSQPALPRSAAAATSSLVPTPWRFLETVIAPTITTTTTTTTTLDLPALKSGGDRKRKAIMLQHLDEEDEQLAREPIGEHDVEYRFGPPRTRRKSGPGTYHTDTNISQVLSPLESSYNSDLRSPAVEAHAGINRNLPPSDTFSDSPKLPAIRSPEATYGPSSNDQTPGSSVPPPQSAVLQLHHNRDVKIILSLDGDGIRGLSQVFLVEALVGAICTKLNATVEPFQIFDLIGGASMGGLLAVLLSRLRLPAHAAREAFKYIAREVFMDKTTFFSSFDLRTQPPVHGGKALEDAIKTVMAAELPHRDECLYDSRAESANVFVVSTQIDIGSNKPALLRSYQSRRRVGPEVDDDMPVWRAIKSSIIAPRYMQPRNSTNWRPIIEPGLVDHGTAKNNPVRDALFECRKLFNYTNDMVVIVSIGTGRGLDQNRESPEMAKTVGNRKAEAEMLSQRFGNENAHLMERGWMKYFRFDVPGLQDVPLEEWCHEDKIREKTTSYLAEPEVGTAFHGCVGEIAAIMTAMPKQL